MLVLFADVNSNNPTEIEKHVTYVSGMTAEDYKHRAEGGLQVAGGRHSLTAMKQIADTDTNFRLSNKFKICNPKYVFYFPCRNKHYVELAR